MKDEKLDPKNWLLFDGRDSAKRELGPLLKLPVTVRDSQKTEYLPYQLVATRFCLPTVDGTNSVVPSGGQRS